MMLVKFSCSFFKICSLRPKDAIQLQTSPQKFFDNYMYILKQGWLTHQKEIIHVIIV